MDQRQSNAPTEIALVGDLTDNEADLTDKLLSIEPGVLAPCSSTRLAAVRTAPCPS